MTNECEVQHTAQSITATDHTCCCIKLYALPLQVSTPTTVRPQCDALLTVLNSHCCYLRSLPESCSIRSPPSNRIRDISHDKNRKQSSELCIDLLYYCCTLSIALRSSSTGCCYNTHLFSVSMSTPSLKSSTALSAPSSPPPPPTPPLPPAVSVLPPPPPVPSPPTFPSHEP